MKDYKNNIKESLDIDSSTYNDTESPVFEQEGGNTECGGNKKIPPKLIAIIAAAAVAIIVVAIALIIILGGSENGADENQGEGGTSDDKHGDNDGEEAVDTIFTYEVNSDGKTCTITGLKAGASEPSELVIPSKIGKYSVSGIGSYAFSGRGEISEVKIEDGITTIGEGAFYYCASLVGIEFPDSVTTIDAGAFGTCPMLKEIKLPKGLKAISEIMFMYCTSLETIEIPDGVTSIGNTAFYYCNSLRSISLPDSLTEIGRNVFNFCSSLEVNEYKNTQYIGKGDNPYYLLVDTNGGASSGTYTVHSSTVFISSNFSSYNLKEIVVEEGNKYFKSIDGNLYTIDGKTLIKFADNKDTGVFRIPDGVTNIKSEAFDYRTKLVGIEIPASVTNIDISFYNISSVADIHVDSDNQSYSSIDGVLYSKDGKTLIYYPAAKEYESFTLPSGVTHISYEAFSNSKLVEIILPDGLQEIGSRAFEYCENLKLISIPDGVTDIGDSAFYSCVSLSEIKLPASLTVLGENLFWRTGIESITIPEGVTIVNSAFQYCESLVSIEIPSTVTSIEAYAFDGCYSLTEIKVDSKNKNYKSIDGDLYSKDGKTLVQYAIGKKGKTFRIPSNVKEIVEGAFRGCTLETIGISSNVETVICGTFFMCENLKSVVIPKSVKKIDALAFYECTSLVEIFYEGSEKQWNKIEIIEDGNEYLLEAEIHYNSNK